MQTSTIEEIKTKYEKDILDFCLSIVQDPDVAFILQTQVFTEVEERLKEYIGDIKIFLFFRARNICINHLNYLKRMTSIPHG